MRSGRVRVLQHRFCELPAERHRLSLRAPEQFPNLGDSRTRSTCRHFRGEQRNVRAYRSRYHHRYRLILVFCQLPIGVTGCDRCVTDRNGGVTCENAVSQG